VSDTSGVFQFPSHGICDYNHWWFLRHMAESIDVIQPPGSSNQSMVGLKDGSNSADYVGPTERILRQPAWPDLAGSPRLGCTMVCQFSCAVPPAPIPFLHEYRFCLDPWL